MTRLTMTQSTMRFFVAVLLWFCLAGVCQACPNCKAAVSQDGDPVALGYAWSIVLMMLAPALIVAAWVRGIRKLLAGNPGLMNRRR